MSNSTVGRRRVIRLGQSRQATRAHRDCGAIGLFYCNCRVLIRPDHRLVPEEVIGYVRHLKEWLRQHAVPRRLMIEFPLAPPLYLDAIRTETERLAIAARRAGLEAAVPTCPGWSIAKLVLHVGVLHRWVASMVAGGFTDRLDVKRVERAPVGDARIAWLEAGSSELMLSLRNAGINRVVWTLPGVGRSAFWFRRMTQETLVHRFDAELAGGSSGPVDPLFAGDGIDEYLFENLGRKLARQPIKGSPAVIRFQATDLEAEWTVLLEDASVTKLESGSSADAVITATTLELLMFLWNRSVLGSSTVQGDHELINNWHERFQI